MTISKKFLFFRIKAKILSILFIVFLLMININVFGETKAICEKDCTVITENSEVNRAAGVIFETGGELYDLFFS